jgi:hypothetical protein
MSVSSFISEKDISSYDESVLFSTSPYVFNEFELVMSYIDEKESLIKLKYDLVVKDILIKGLQKKLKKYEIGYNVYMSLLSGKPFLI